MSAVESAANVAIGFGIALVATMTVLPAFGYSVTPRDSVGITLCFTIISLVRSYTLRRLFNKTFPSIGKTYG